MGEDEAKKKRKRSKSKKKEKKEKKEEKDDDEASTEKKQQDETPEQVEPQVVAVAVAVDEEPKMKEEEEKKTVVGETMDEQNEATVDEKTEATEPKDDDGDDGDEAVKPKRKRTRKRKKAPAEDDEDTPEQLSAADKEAAKKLESLDYTIYVEGIPFDSTEEHVKEFFCSHGCTDIIQMRLSRWQDSGRLRGYGHVVFDTTASRNKAITDCHKKHMGQRYLSIQAPKQPRADTLLGSAAQSTPRDQPTGCNVVFVKNLPYHAQEDDVQEAFQVCGKIVDGGVRIVRNYQNRQSKGFAYVEYKNPEGAHGSVQKASKPFGMKVLGRPVFVDYDEGRMRGSFKNEDGQLWSKEHKVTKPSNSHHKSSHKK